MPLHNSYRAWWWMFDNHTFKRLSDDPSLAAAEAEECFEIDPWGSLFSRDAADRIVAMIHGHGRERVAEFSAALETVKALGKGIEDAAN